MARASTRTLLSLDDWAKIMGFHPLHFNGIQVPGLAPANICGQPIMQYAWQQVDGVSREDIAEAIAEAESRIAFYTRFKLLPTYEIDERHQWTRPAQADLFSSWMLGVGGQGATVRTDWGHVISGGIEGFTPILAGAGVAYADLDGDGYKETATVTVTTTVTDPNEITVIYPNELGDRAWEIRPIRVTISGGVATITMRREQLLNPGLMESLSSTRAIDGGDDSAFSTTVDVYRSYIDPSQQVQFLWENTFGSCGCDSSTCSTCYLSAQFGCTVVRDYRTGLLVPSSAVWNATTQNYEATVLSVPRAPDRVRLWYRAGWRDQSRTRSSVEMDPRYARAVAYFATSILARPMCACSNVTAAVEYWQEDLAKTKFGQASSENYQIDRSLLSNPFGTTRGAVYAWRLFSRQAIGEAVLV